MLAAEVLLAGAVARVHAERGNTLLANGRWESTKTELEHDVMAAFEFVGSWRSLVGGKLELSAWHGFQEVMLKEPVAPRTVSYCFEVDPGGYVSVLFGATASGRSGLRLGVNDTLPPEWFSESVDRRVLQRLPLALSGAELGIEPGRWHRVRLEFEGDKVRGFLGETSLGEFELAPSGAEPGGAESAGAGGGLGFRGGFRRAWVDDLVVETADGAPSIRESFFPRGRFLGAMLPLVLVALALDAWAARQLRSSRMPAGRRVALALGTITLLVGGAGVLLLGNEYLGRRYKTIPASVEDAWRKSRLERDTGAIAAREPDPEALRVLIIGSSQTAGSGASHRGEDLVSVTEELLNAAGGRKWQCIMGGIPATKSGELLAAYEGEWLERLQPAIVVVNLSSNDNHPPQFEANLERFAELGREHGIATLFSLEANSFEKWPDALPLHAVMRAVAERNGLAVVDPHRYLAQRTALGVQWWDFVHPTSLGHRLIAEALAPAIAELGREL